ncbi:hypothetical protein [Embleya sp. AB8]|uniref:hypothetical protein n=1 Tax=Embleya sp. AB8 TaxID=3156304 RepID=UPI003C77E99C
MSGSFKVVLAEMDDLFRKLDSCAGEMKTAMNAMKETGPGRTGHKSLDSACDHFQSEWSYGIELIHKNTAGITGVLGTIRDNYKIVEDSIADALQKAADGRPANNAAGPIAGKTNSNIANVLNGAK